MFLEHCYVAAIFIEVFRVKLKNVTLEEKDKRRTKQGICEMFLNCFSSWSLGTGLEIYVLNRWGVFHFQIPVLPVPIDWLRKDKHHTSPIQNENWLHVNPLKCQNHSVSPSKTKLLKPCADTNAKHSCSESKALFWYCDRIWNGIQR